MPPKESGDFDPKQAASRLDALDDFKKEYEGAKFYEKVTNAIKESVPVQSAIKSVFIAVLKEKAAWVLFGAIGLVAIDLLRELGSKLISKI